MEGFFLVVRRRGAPLVPRSGMRVTEGRKGGGAEACSVELAKRWNGRADRGTVQKRWLIEGLLLNNRALWCIICIQA